MQQSVWCDDVVEESSALIYSTLLLQPLMIPCHAPLQPQCPRLAAIHACPHVGGILNTPVGLEYLWGQRYVSGMSYASTPSSSAVSKQV